VDHALSVGIAQAFADATEVAHLGRQRQLALGVADQDIEVLAGEELVPTGCRRPAGS
jgi:hypothetical protein